jgi:hypothetical protein
LGGRSAQPVSVFLLASAMGRLVPAAALQLVAALALAQRAQEGQPESVSALRWASVMARPGSAEALQLVAVLALAQRARAEQPGVALVCGAARPEAESARAAAEPAPEAVSVPWAQQAAAAVGLDASGAEAAAASDVVAPQRAVPVAALAHGAVQPWAAVRSGAREPQAAVPPAVAVLPGARRAAVPLALPSEPASVFRQAPSLGAGPALPPAAARFAHAMRRLRIASRSVPSWRAARNERWS